MRTFGLVLIASGFFVAPTSAQTAASLGPKTVIPSYVACGDMPTSTPPDAALRILAPHSGNHHQASARGELVVLSAGTTQGVAIGQRYFSRRLLPPLERQAISPQTRGAVRTTGWLTVVAADEVSSLARVDYGCTTVEAGDFLQAFGETALPAEVSADGEADFGNLGRVLLGPDRREAFGAGDLLTIDRGSAGGVAVGMRVGFYRDRLNGTPLFELGVGVVVEVLPDAAKVVLERAGDTVRSGDYFARRGR